MRVRPRIVIVMRIGIDLGGTKIEIIALDDAGSIAARRRIATPAGDYDGIVAAIVALVRGVESDLATTATVGVGMPGAISLATGLVKNANSTVLIGRRFPSDLEKALGREIRVENDANCFALSEASDGAGADAATVFGVILGTGAGGGIVVDGRVVRGRNAIAGEWGHNPLPGRAQTKCRGPHATAERWVASKRSSRARGYVPIFCDMAVRRRTISMWRHANDTKTDSLAR